ncbi:hypothetical protein BAG01nite_31090 [Brevibacillus agri]|uniref:Antibiotic biosynthesis monooxygenase n=1 Tax=Brevibacillus agri TaxID=51101 RepID=A0A3M8AJL1_9BACL|nr:MULTISPECIES: MFS transporter [Brevibacillus]ELK43491.1 hypothetical protein D478_03167 [Brevibacillus agri BAB-2500]EJL47340.1 hypothetical protein (DUF894) [Brevibacillus sp. CF112]MBG9566986.1 hypothetical protein [Brevibacillus agri]MBY0053636.1 MFS transporter [Brevibacillus agri]MCG5252989.1 MFS transporter [Brevibacillus agri]
MLTVFIEYKLQSEKRDQALRLLASMAESMEALGARQYRCMEGLDQPGLFVEAFEVETVHEYEQIKAHRLADRAFCDCVAGGADKLHVWAFRPAALPQ